MNTRFIRGNISNSSKESAYEVIGRILSELQQIGFVLKTISTTGETSIHDWTFAFRHQYASFDAFLAQADADYRIESRTKTGGPSPDWDFTSFELFQSFSINLFTHNNGMFPPRPYKATWCMTVPDSLPDNDELLQNTLSLLRQYE